LIRHFDAANISDEFHAAIISSTAAAIFTLFIFSIIAACRCAAAAITIRFCQRRFRRALCEARRACPPHAIWRAAPSATRCRHFASFRFHAFDFSPVFITSHFVFFFAISPPPPPMADFHFIFIAIIFLLRFFFAIHD
jgi:hypothetical protein